MTACQPQQYVDGHRIYYAGTRDYDKQVAALKYNPWNAAEIIIAAERRKEIEKGEDPNGPHFVGDLYVLIGTNYVFSSPSKYVITLSGRWVDGNTGEITEDHDGALKFPPSWYSWRHEDYAKWRTGSPAQSEPSATGD